MLHGPSRESLDYLNRTYWRAILSYIRGRLARHEFPPLRPDDAEDVLQELFVRLGRSDWLAKPDRRRGRFRPYLVRRIVYFLRERRAVALGRPTMMSDDAAAETLAAPDELDARLESEWRAATLRAAIEQLGRESLRYRAVIEAELKRGDRSDAEVAAELGCTAEAYRSLRRRAKKRLQEIYKIEERRLDGIDDHGSDDGGDDGDAR